MATPSLLTASTDTDLRRASGQTFGPVSSAHSRQPSDSSEAVSIPPLPTGHEVFSESASSPPSLPLTSHPPSPPIHALPNGLPQPETSIVTDLPTIQPPPAADAASPSTSFATHWTARAQDEGWGSNFWVTLVDPASGTSFFACPSTGAVSWDAPVGNFVLPPSTEGEWWELADESRAGLPYYYHTRTGETVWERPSGQFVIPLGVVQNTALGRRLSSSMSAPSASSDESASRASPQRIKHRHTPSSSSQRSHSRGHAPEPAWTGQLPPIPGSPYATEAEADPDADGDAPPTPSTTSSKRAGRSKKDSPRKAGDGTPPHQRINGSNTRSHSFSHLPQSLNAAVEQVVGLGIAAPGPATPGIPGSRPAKEGDATTPVKQNGTSSGGYGGGSTYASGWATSSESMHGESPHLVRSRTDPPRTPTRPSADKRPPLPSPIPPSLARARPSSKPSPAGPSQDGLRHRSRSFVRDMRELLAGSRPGTPGREKEKDKGQERARGRSKSRERSRAPVPPSPKVPVPVRAGVDNAPNGRSKTDACGNGMVGRDISGPVLDREATMNMTPTKSKSAGRAIPVTASVKSLDIDREGSLGTHPILPKELVSDIQQFVESDYAKQYFSTHRTGFLFRRTVPMERMMTWQKAPLTSPLLLLNRALHKETVKIFKVIQRIMGDRERDRPVGVRSPAESPSLHLGSPPTPGGVRNSTGVREEERWLLAEGLSHGELRDEIYCQLMKQLSGNPSSESMFRGWQLLCVLLITFPPSKDFEPYLQHFMKQHTSQSEGRVDVMAKHCLRRLAVISKKGPRGKPPIIAEIETASDAAFNPSIFGESLDSVFRLQERSYPDARVPIILPFLADGILALGGTRAEGIFRVPGDGDLVSDLKLRIDRGTYTLDGMDDPHVLASTLKLWLRELLAPPIPDELYNECVAQAKDAEACVRLVARLPTIHRRVVLFVISFFQLFLDERAQTATKMTSTNLALVLAPNLLRCSSESMAVVFTNAQFEHHFVHNLLLHLKCDEVDPDYRPVHGLAPSTNSDTRKARR